MPHMLSPHPSSMLRPQKRPCSNQSGWGIVINETTLYHSLKIRQQFTSFQHQFNNVSILDCTHGRTLDHRGQPGACGVTPPQ